MDTDRKYSQSDLVLNNGAVYHLALDAQQLASSIVLVGDPERVPLITKRFFSDVGTDIYHRGLRTQTGIVVDSGQQVSVVTTGMGTSSAEIVLGELAALAEIDLDSRIPLQNPRTLSMIRVGTSGGLQPENITPLGTLIITAYAIGLDNTGLFYHSQAVKDEFASDLEERIERLLNDNLAKSSPLKNHIRPYVTKADSHMVSALQQACQELGFNFRLGITVSNSGFFASQGRDNFRIKASLPNIDQLLANFDTGMDLKLENMEMESSFILHFCAGMGYAATAVCPTVANRSNNTFIEDSLTPIYNAAAAALRAHQLIG